MKHNPTPVAKHGPWNTAENILMEDHDPRAHRVGGFVLLTGMLVGTVGLGWLVTSLVQIVWP